MGYTAGIFIFAPISIIYGVIMQNHPVIELKNLSVGYKDRRGDAAVISGIDASLHSGELTCLLGQNGAGKSTLLRTLCGFQPALTGEVMVFGRSISDYSEGDLSKIIGVVLTDRVQLNNVSVRQVVEMGRSPYTGFWGRLSAEDRTLVEEAMELVGITALQNKMMNSISDGERQKTMIAKALAQCTPVIILDEPSAYLDYPSKADLMRLLAELAHSKDKMIFQSTHDLDIALQTSDKIWLLDREKGLTIGTPTSLSDNGEFNRYFDRNGLTFRPEGKRFEVVV